MLSVMNSKAKHGDMLNFPYESGFLGAFARLRKETFVMSVRLSFRPHGTTRLTLNEC
jgi:hypothetical protein